MGEIPWGFNRIFKFQDKRVGGVGSGVGMSKLEEPSREQEEEEKRRNGMERAMRTGKNDDGS
jgi:hypothetical protein